MVSIFSSSRRCSDWFLRRRAVSERRRAISSAVRGRFRRVSMNVSDALQKCVGIKSEMISSSRITMEGREDEGRCMRRICEREGLEG